MGAVRDSDGKSTSKRIRKLGSPKELAETLSAGRDGVMAWAKEQARLEAEKYKGENEAKTVLVLFHAGIIRAVGLILLNLEAKMNFKMNLKPEF